MLQKCHNEGPENVLLMKTNMKIMFHEISTYF